MPVKVAIVGAGSVGSKLGGRLLASGNAVRYGVRNTASEKYQPLLKEQPLGALATVDDAVAWSDAVILATPSQHTDEGIRNLASSLGPNIKGKVLIDATNPLSPFPALEVRWGGKSGGELLAEALPQTHVLKSFNTIGAEHMVQPGGEGITGQQLTMLLAGAPEGRDIAELVVAGVGFKPKYVGPIRYARNLEAIAELWIHLGVLPAGFTKENWGRDFHFQVINKGE